MARCDNCIHEKVCLHKVNIQTDTYAYMGFRYDITKCEHFTPDVAPKSEVERLEKEVDRLSQVVLYHDAFKADEIKDAKAEVAREIFEEIESLAKIYTFPVVKNGIVEIEKEPSWCIEPSDLAKLKKKYTEGI